MTHKFTIYNLQFKSRGIKRQGFTLIELLVVISIIGILAALSVASYTVVQKQARDVTRKSDLAQYRNAMEAFANANNGLFPNSAPGKMINLCNAALLGKYAASCPEDPKYSDSDTSHWYGVYSVGSGALGTPTATKYFMYVNGGLESNPSTAWVVCSNGKTGATNNSWSPGVATFCQ